MDEPITKCHFSDWIELPCLPSDDLNWSIQIEKARSLVSLGRKIVWKFDLGLEHPYYPLEDELRFQSAGLALKQFSHDVWPEFKEQTLALSLYRGLVNFSEFFLWTDRQRANFASWKEDEESDDLREFAADAFAIYFQMLAHRLPDEAPIFLLFDLGPMQSVSKALRVISKQRFEHFLIAIKGSLPVDRFVWSEDGIEMKKIVAATGAVFPENRAFDLKFDALLAENRDAKAVYETSLTEDWEGLDRLLVLNNSLSLQGNRKLKGFEATAAQVQLIY